MTNEVEVVPTAHFRREFKRLRKKYRRIQTDLQPLIEQLQQGETPGDPIQGVGYTVYKVRVRNSDTQRGKSGGYRVVYYVQTETFVFLLDIYAKSEQEDISVEALARLIDELADDAPPDETGE